MKRYESFTENQKITAFQNFGSIFVGKSRNRIKVQPTAVSRRKSKNGSRQKQSNVKTKTLPIRPTKTKRKHNITAAPPRWSSPCRSEGAYPPRSSRVPQRGELN